MTGETMQTLVIGSGTMAPSLALCLTLAGHHTALVARRSEALAGAEAAAERGYGELAEADLLPATAPGWRERLTFDTDMRRAVQEIDFAFEAISEDAESKQALFATLDNAAPPGAILASTTSGMAVDIIAEKCVRQGRVAVAHFANPPHLMPAVEVVPGGATEGAVMDRLCAFIGGLGKEPIRLKRDLPGHLFNRLQFALMREAFALVRDGAADAEDIDKVVKNGYALRLAAEGPLEKADLAGLPLVASVAAYLYPDLDTSQAPEDLTAMIGDGKSGAQTGNGFFDWTPERAAAVVAERNQEVIRHLKRMRAKKGE
ncbi:MAG: 3-hydroxyacyl-CoA dehydrogenase NAD-binding domain-containing protein [Alphaproteobacteria bacterium]|nr:3-hydroxyacyl-CoA dehydrogenase NAD-binding domain-containing protein [Alphaproteobacteria bacterium]MDP6819300.1 3-hydroxyacyl-CoA dehydrogenase NAD-binding domain-containing protein [Alphaproteobacteria bacterium]